MEGQSMKDEDRKLLVETLAEMRELRGELTEFKLHVMGRVERLEKRAWESNRTLFSVLSIIASVAALIVSVAGNFIRSMGR
jgi:hypothetical protein